ncbi:hypothetical protein HDU78_004856 [Chytriomyces hyalinus]|nr:hypothetical protein HDU78_004856 [Chytriomyces hyalinus]
MADTLPAIVHEMPPLPPKAVVPGDALPLKTDPPRLVRIKNYVQSLSASLGTKIDFKVWIVRDMYLKPLCELEHGWFFAGNCYVILNTRSRGKSVYSDVSVWIGSKAMDIDIGHAIFKAQEMRECTVIGLKNCAIHKETQFNETQLFLENFKYLRYTHGERFHVPGNPSRKRLGEIPSKLLYQNTFGPLLSKPTLKQASKKSQMHGNTFIARMVDKLPALNNNPPPKTAGTTNLADIVLYMSTMVAQQNAQIEADLQQKREIEAAQERFAAKVAKSNSDSQHPLLYAFSRVPYNQCVLPETLQKLQMHAPALFRIHRAASVRAEASRASIVIEEIILSKDFETAVEPDPDADDDDNEEEGDKPPTATRLPPLMPGQQERVLPRGWKIWDKRFKPDKEGVYVFEGDGYLWIFGNGCHAAAPTVPAVSNNTAILPQLVAAKVDTGLLSAAGPGMGRPSFDVGVVRQPPIEASTAGANSNNTSGGTVNAGNLAEKSDAEVERILAFEWAKEVARIRGHGKFETIDETDALVNKLWISLGVKANSLFNELTASEQRLNEWETEKEEELEWLREQEDNDGDDSKPTTRSSNKTARDPTSFFSKAQILPSANTPILYKLINGHRAGTPTIEEVERGIVRKEHLSNNQVHFLDVGNRLFVWVGSLCDAAEQSDSLMIGQEFLIKNGMSTATPITGLVEKGENEAFAECFNGEDGEMN